MAKPTVFVLSFQIFVKPLNNVQTETPIFIHLKTAVSKSPQDLLPKNDENFGKQYYTF